MPTESWQVIMPPRRPLLDSIQQSSDLNERTRTEYVSSIRRAMHVCKSTSVTQLLINKPGKRVAELRAAYPNANTLNNMITAVRSVFKHNPKFADEHGRALRVWKEHGRKDCAAVQSARNDNRATTDDVERMVPLQKVADAAARCSHSSASESQDKVLLSIAAHSPARRADLGIVHIVDKLSATRGKGNYIVVPAGTTRGTTLVLNDCKTHNFCERIVEPLHKIISDAVRDSVKAWPRKYLLVRKVWPNTGGPLDYAAYSKRYQEVMFRHTGYKTNLNLARHAYITEMANPMDRTVAETEQIARYMMHSANRQRLHFKAIPKADGSTRGRR